MRLKWQNVKATMQRWLRSDIAKIKQKEDENKATQEKLRQLQGEGAMIKEEVDAEDIAEIVSRWTEYTCEEDGSE